MAFSRLGLHPSVLKGVRSAGYTEPTPIQVKAIPPILAGDDLVGAAQTGTGKTAAFILPILSNLVEGIPSLRALVLTPTRELAAQVETNARDYSRHTRLRVGVVYGGVPIPPQERMLRGPGVDLLVATPGRLLDLHGRQSVTFDDIQVLVLDEADRMVDMGFAPDLLRILRLLPRDRQTLLFSATIPPDLNKVAREALVNPVRIDLAPPSKPAAGITQAIYPVAKPLKTDLLQEILQRTDAQCVIVFTRTKRGAERLYRSLQRRGSAVAVLHGDRTQSQRERALSDLRRGRVEILVATDIAARGIDVDGISHVINFDVPNAPEDYVHRIGRTGRADAIGDAFTLMSPEERGDIAAIEKFLGRSIPRVTLPDFDYNRRATPEARGAEPERGGRGGRGPRAVGSGRPARESREHRPRTTGPAKPWSPPEAPIQHGRKPKTANPLARGRR